MDDIRNAINRKSLDDADKSSNKVDRAVEESFPASDPPSHATPQPTEGAASPQQADAHTAEGKQEKQKQADWKGGKAVRGTPEPPAGTEEARHQDRAAKR